MPSLDEQELPGAREAQLHREKWPIDPLFDPETGSTMGGFVTEASAIRKELQDAFRVWAICREAEIETRKAVQQAEQALSNAQFSFNLCANQESAAWEKLEQLAGRGNEE